MLKIDNIKTNLINFSFWLTLAVGIIGGLLYFFGLLIKAFQWSVQGPIGSILSFFQNQYILVLLILLIFILLIPSIFRINKLEHYIYKRYVINFDAYSPEKWDCDKVLSMADGSFVITDCDRGCISKIGINWENYTIKFKAKIVNLCLGIIIRAQDLDNYYLFKVNENRITPLRRLLAFVISEDKSPNPGANLNPVENLAMQPEYEQFTNLRPEVGWQFNTGEFHTPGFEATEFPKINDWFNCKVVVNNQSIFIYINDQLCFERSNFLLNSTGKFGFRNFGTERAYVKNLSISLD